MPGEGGLNAACQASLLLWLVAHLLKPYSRFCWA